MLASSLFGFNILLDTVILGTILRVRWPHQRCRSPEGQWLVNQVKGQSHHAQLNKGKVKNVTKNNITLFYRTMKTVRGAWKTELNQAYAHLWYQLHINRCGTI